MTQEMTTTSILSLFETNEAQRQSFVSDVISRIESGDVEPLTIHLQLKSIEDVIKLLTSNSIYRDAVLTEAEKRGKLFEYGNSTFQTKEAGVKYDWSKCNDPELEAKVAELETLAAEVKARQEFLKTVPVKGLEIRHDDELITIYPPAKSSTTTVQVTLK